VTEKIDFVPIMPGVAKLLLGEPNKNLSTKLESRYGNNGSISVDLKKAVWRDHEESIGGGVLELIRAYTGLSGQDGMKWLEEKGFIPKLEPKANGHHAPRQPAEFKVPGGFPDFMDPKPIACFEYFDDKGELAYQVLKFPKTAQRRYMQRRPYKGGWVWGLQAGEWGRKRTIPTGGRPKRRKPMSRRYFSMMPLDGSIIARKFYMRNQRALKYSCAKVKKTLKRLRRGAS
jgi:hypothetical protein